MLASNGTERKEAFCLLLTGGDRARPKNVVSFSLKIRQGKAATFPDISRTKRTILSVCMRQGTVSGLVGCHVLTVHPSSDHSKPLCRNELVDPCAEEENRHCVFGEFSLHC